MRCCSTCKDVVAGAALRSADRRAALARLSAPAAAIAGLDPAIHLLRESLMRSGWTTASSPVVTTVCRRTVRGKRADVHGYFRFFMPGMAFIYAPRGTAMRSISTAVVTGPAVLLLRICF